MFKHQCSEFGAIYRLEFSATSTVLSSTLLGDLLKADVLDM